MGHATQEGAVQAQIELKSWLAERGIKQGWLAAQIPVTLSTLSKWMNKKGVPSAVCRHRLADITDIEILRDEGYWA
jgi:DNA-binding Xre family transcriptional regulator